MKASARSLAVAAALVGSTLASHGDPVQTGDLSLVGVGQTTGYNIRSSPLGLTPVAATSGSVSELFSTSTGLDSVALHSLEYAHVNGSSDGQDLVQLLSSGSASTLTVDLTRVTEGACHADDLCVSGTGFLNEASYEEMPATLDPTQNRGDVRFSAMISASPAPEPSSLLLLGTGLVVTGAALHRRKRYADPSEPLDRL